MITNYRATGDWFYILPAIALIDFIVIVLAKYPSNKPLFGVAINKWYDEFGIFAVGADILSIAIGIAAARYIFSFGFTSIPAFLGILVAFQLAHDIFFYTAIIRPMPAGHNRMIDVFKAYSEENGAMILVSDALMMVSSVGVASLLKMFPAHVTISFTLVVLYALCYAIYTRNP